MLKARSISAERDVVISIGWQTPLIGLVVMLDLISFWIGAWDVRDAIPNNFTSLVFGALLAGIYYAAASLVFPDDPHRWPDLDDWFERHKSQVAAGIFAANLLFSAGEVALFGTWAATVHGQILQVLYLAMTLALIFTKGGKQSLIILWGLVAIFKYLAFAPVIFQAA